jgi:transketolase
MDIAVMRAMPNLAVVVAADATEAQKLVPVVAEYDGPVYLRLSRAEVPVVFGDDHEVEIGKGHILRDGMDVTVIATGVMVSRALLAAQTLEQEGVDARVVSLHTIKPLDRELVLASAERTCAVVTVEEHSVIGGLGGAVAELLGESRPVPVTRVGIRDTFTDTGPYEALLDCFGMAVADVVSAAHRAIGMKK